MKIKHGLGQKLGLGFRRRMINMMLQQYVKELKKIHMLSREEEETLWCEYKDHADLNCRSKIIEHYQPLVFKIATGWRLDESTIMDMIQEGTVGLIEAVEKYDHQRGVAFSLYASQRIRGRMLNYMEREGKFGVTYIDSPLSGEQDRTLGDLLVDTGAGVSSQAEHNYLVEQVRNAMERLPVKEQAVLSGVFLEDCEPKQLAESLDMSISHIYRLQKQGIRRVRGMLSKFMQHW
jgi:RNA polymerase sporulation-specific sigma factor